ncbi:hypothetical protein PV963_34295 [Streptomyces coeruleorubidus]|nr:hypothetical protein [Streptomyces coeruleorubidus]WDV55067.1 hypothetical protein PV963_34295 [Streptomyces coeruleorubidus]
MTRFIRGRRTPQGPPPEDSREHVVPQPKTALSSSADRPGL